MGNKNYAVYHLHDDNSLLDSCTNYKEYIIKAVELGQTSICFSNHGNVHNWVEKKMYCDEVGIKYMFGVECYLTEHLEPKIRDNYHTILISRNEQGQIELQRLLFNATDEQHKYYKPRISFDEFLNISDNIIKISACLASPLNRIRDLDRVEKLFQHYDYYEIQYHNGDQIEYNQYLYKMSKKYNKPLIVGTDTHNLNDYKAECRVVLQMGKDAEFSKGDSDGSNEDVFDMTYKSYDELVKVFKEQDSLPMDIVLQAIENTNVMANSVESFELDTSIKYPVLYGEDDEKVMWQTLRDKYKHKISNGIIKENQRYIDDIKEEMRVFKKTDMVGFMLFMSELMTWCREQGIPTSPCRGCFTKDALVYTKNNYKTIDKINIGDKVLADDGLWHNVINKMSYGIKEDMVEFEYLKQGSSYKKYKNICTTDHKILVNRNSLIEYIKADNLEVGDLLCSPKIKNQFETKEDMIIDLVNYNFNGFEYDNKYIYEIVNTNIAYKYSPRWCERNIGVNSNFCKNIANGYRPTHKRGIDLANKILNNTPFNTIENYAKYVNKHKYTIIKTPRYIKLGYVWNLFIGMMYGDGWTQKDSALGFAVNRTSKNDYNRKVFYTIANKLGLNVYVNKSKNKNLDQLFINSRPLNNWFRTEFFESKKGKDKIFNESLFDQNNRNLKALYCGLLRTDGSTSVDNKTSFDSTSLSLISAYKTLDNMVNRIMPNCIDVRFAHEDKRGFNNKESYKARRSTRMTDRLIIKLKQ